MDMEQFRHFGTVFVKEDHETGKVVQKPRLFIAKLQQTGPHRLCRRPGSELFPAQDIVSGLASERIL